MTSSLTFLRLRRPGLHRPAHRRRWLALAAIGAAGVTAVATVSAVGLAGAATSNCSVTYQVSQWSTGFTANVGLTNLGPAVSSWSLTWTFASNQTITSAWNTQASQAGQAVTATNLSYNGSLATNGTVQIGFLASYSGTNATPTNFALNGAACGDSATPTTTAAPTTPAATTPASTTPAATTTAATTTPAATTTAATTTPAAMTTAASGCGTATTCDGFESQTGTAPAGDWSVTYPSCSGTGTATVDSTVAHSGTRSIRIDGGAGYCNHVFLTRTAGIPTGPLFARFYVRHSTALPTDHVTFAAMHDTTTGKDLRMGGQNQALQWNRESDDATLPAQSPVGGALSVPLPVDTWSCVEFRVDGAAGEMQTWLNGTEVAGLHADTTPTADVDAQWGTYHPSLTDFRLGWESYGNGADTLWFDDVALSSSRIGC